MEFVSLDEAKRSLRPKEDGLGVVLCYWIGGVLQRESMPLVRLSLRKKMKIPHVCAKAHQGLKS